MLEFNFSKTFKISDLNRLRGFLNDGVTFNVIAVKHSYVPEDPKLSEEHNTEEGIQTSGTSEKQTDKTSASKDRTKLDAKERKKSAKNKVFVSVSQNTREKMNTLIIVNRCYNFVRHTVNNCCQQPFFTVVHGQQSLLNNCSQSSTSLFHTLFFALVPTTL